MTEARATWAGPSALRLSAERLDQIAIASSLLAAAAAVAAIVSAATAPLRLDGYGLAGALPPIYYVALACLPLATALEWLRGPSASSSRIVMHIVLWVLIVWLTPLVMEQTPRFRTSYTNFGYVDPLVRGDGLLPSRLIYHNWPLFPTVMAWLVRQGVPTLALLALFPTALMLASLVPLAVIVRTLAPSASRAAAPAAPMPIPDAALPPPIRPPAVQAAGAVQPGPPDCAGCGRPLRWNVRFCRSCGQAATVAPTCAECGGPVRWNARFCRSCGAPASIALRLRASIPKPPPGGAPYVQAAWPAGLWLFAVFNWTNQDYFSPQAAAYLMFLVWLAAVLRVARGNGELSLRSLLLVVGLFAMTVVTHLLTSLAMLGVLAGLVTFGLVRRPTLFVTCALIFMVWQVHGAWPFFRFYGDRLQETLFDVVNFFEANVASRVTGSPEHAQIAALRIGVTGLVFALAALAVLLTIRKPAQRRGIAASLTVLIGIAIVAPAALYGGEMMIRVLLFSLPVLGALVASAFWLPAFRVLVAVVLIAMAPIHMLSHYGNELHDYVSPHELEGFAYVASLGPANVFGGYPAANFENTMRLDARNSYLSRSSLPSQLEDFHNPRLHHVWENEDWPTYVVVSRGDEAAMDLFQDRAGFMTTVLAALEVDPDFEIVFRNPDVTVFRWLAAGVPVRPATADIGDDR